MAKMNEKVRTLFENQALVALATSSADGSPNVVPIGAKKVLDDETILISDQYFNKTLANLKENPQVALTLWDAQTFDQGHDHHRDLGRDLRQNLSVDR